MIFQKTLRFFPYTVVTECKNYNRDGIYWLRATIPLTLILVLKGVATHVQTYSVVFDEIWYADLPYKLVEFNCGVGGRTLSCSVRACPVSSVEVFLKNGMLDRPWISLIAVA